MSKSHGDFRALWLIVLGMVFPLIGCGGALTNIRTGLGDESGDCSDDSVSEAELLRLDADVESRVGVRIEVARQTCTRVTCDPVSSSQGRITADMYESLAEELGRYTPGFLREHGPSVIWLVSGLKASFASWEAAGVALGSDRVIYLNVRQACSPAARRSVIQHELFHVFDADLFRSEAANATWQGLNPPGFQYSLDYDAGLKDLHPRQGFVTDYATTNVREDRAEVYRFQVTQEYSGYLSSWIQEDAYLRAKDRTLRAAVNLAWPGKTPLQSIGPSTAQALPPSPFEASPTSCGGMIAVDQSSVDIATSDTVEIAP